MGYEACIEFVYAEMRAVVKEVLGGEEVGEEEDPHHDGDLHQGEDHLQGEDHPQGEGHLPVVMDLPVMMVLLLTCIYFMLLLNNTIPNILPSNPGPSDWRRDRPAGNDRAPPRPDQDRQGPPRPEDRTPPKPAGQVSFSTLCD